MVGEKCQDALSSGGMRLEPILKEILAITAYNDVRISNRLGWTGKTTR
jgi:hypothetical protein